MVSLGVSKQPGVVVLVVVDTLNLNYFANS